MRLRFRPSTALTVTPRILMSSPVYRPLVFAKYAT